MKYYTDYFKYIWKRMIVEIGDIYFVDFQELIKILKIFFWKNKKSLMKKVMKSKKKNPN